MSEEIKNEIEELSKQWMELSNEVDSNVRGLEGVKEIIDFDAKVRRILDKIRTKVTIMYFIRLHVKILFLLKCFQVL